MNVIYLGIDLAKNVFQLCGLNQAGKPVYKKRTDRKTLLQTVANIPDCLIGVEASTGAFYWQREFEKLGHKVKVISPQYVKPFVHGQKSSSTAHLTLPPSVEAYQYLVHGVLSH
ncbi:hypothetical protein PEC730217_22530 [Pectobacterium carotovorum subsp. carotovorum]|nr:hypothetical protein PEC730217_22530 [Pectobacterium carotovorum subsp. carotovorum]